MLNHHYIKKVKSIVNKIIRSALSNVLYALHSAGFYSLKKGNNITILMYHKINYCDDVNGLCITPNIFEEQIKFLAMNYDIISLHEAVEKLTDGTIDKKYIVITFDDGYRDNYTFAYPILSKYNVQATIFLTCASLEDGTFLWELVNDAIMSSPMEVLDLDKYGVGRLSLRNRTEKIAAIHELHRALKKMSNHDLLCITSEIIELHGTKTSQERVMLNCDEVKEMIRSGHIAIGSHTVSHPILTRIGKEQAFEEISGSKRILEDLFGGRIDHFSYPNGTNDDFNDEVVDLVKNGGYKSACSTIPGFNSGNDVLYELRRFDVTNNSSLNLFGGFSESRLAVLLSGTMVSLKKLFLGSCYR